MVQNKKIKKFFSKNKFWGECKQIQLTDYNKNGDVTLNVVYRNEKGRYDSETININAEKLIDVLNAKFLKKSKAVQAIKYYRCPKCLCFVKTNSNKCTRCEQELIFEGEQ